MKVASGYYLNVFDPSGKRDVFVIFNEPNPAPTAEELSAIAELVEREIQNGPTCGRLRIAIENSGVACVEYGVQVFWIVRG